MKKLINKLATRKFILQVANDSMPAEAPVNSVDSRGRQWDYSRCFSNIKKYTSVSQEYIDAIDAELRNLIKQKIKSNPPRGKTVK